MRLIDADALPVQKAYIVDEAGWGANFYVVDMRDIDEAPTIQQPEWISCAERLPTEGVSIEMFFPISQSICLGYYREIAKKDFWCVKFPDGTGRLGDEKPTRWRYRYITETPQPPKGDE